MSIDSHSIRFDLKNSANKLLQYDRLEPSHHSSIFSTHKWQVSALEEYRILLNGCKSQLNNVLLSLWDKHTEFSEISGDVKWAIHNNLNIKPPILTRAWMKFYEIISSFELFQVDRLEGRSVKAFFLCEAPGGFINAANHYIKSKHSRSSLQLQWLANTLNPYYECTDVGANVLDDRFIQNVYWFKDRWYFGPSNTGDILEENFIEKFQEHLVDNQWGNSGEGCFDFVTADGAFSCIDNYAQQEELVFPLIFKEMLIAVNVLKNGGSFVVKMFTFFSCETISMLYLITTLFNRVTLYKPCTSKHGNSEIYLVCTGFDRATFLKSYQSILNQTSSNELVFKFDLLPKSFIDRLIFLTGEIIQIQTTTINENFNQFNNPQNVWYDKRCLEKNAIANEFLDKYNLNSIAANEQLVFERFVFASRRFSQKLLPHVERYLLEKNFSEFQNGLVPAISSLLRGQWQKDYSINVRSSFFQLRNYLQPVWGKNYDEINNSKYCCAAVMKIYQIFKQKRQQSASQSQFLMSLMQKSSQTSQLNADSLVGLKRNISASSLASNPSPASSSSSPFLFSKICTLLYVTTLGPSLNYTPINIRESKDDFNAYLFKQFERLYENRCGQQSNIFVLSLTDLTSDATANDQQVSAQLVENLNGIASKLQVGDHMIVAFRSLLSRLTTSLVLLITKMFAKFSPFITSHAGQSYVICHFAFYEKTPDFIQILLKNFAQWMRMGEGRALLEVLPVPIVMQDVSFYLNIFDVNSSLLLNILSDQLMTVKVESNRVEEGEATKNCSLLEQEMIAKASTGNTKAASTDDSYVANGHPSSSSSTSSSAKITPGAARSNKQIGDLIMAYALQGKH